MNLFPQAKAQDFASQIENPIVPTQDFWSRQANVQTESFDCAPFGLPVQITANEPKILAAARLSARRFSQAEELTGEPIRIQIVVRSDAGGSLPDNLSEQLVYSGLGDWITLSTGRWGHGFANLKMRQAVIVLSQALADEPRLVSRYFVDHYLLNFILTDWAMLHASCVLDPERRRLVVMIGPHNAGKSTTALRLLQAGYIFLADGMALLRRGDDGFRVGGYPIGEVKLRDDVLASFPEYTGQRFKVREQHKTVVNLQAAHPERVVEQIIQPPAIQLCLVERRDTARTEITKLSPAEFLPHLAANTLYWDELRRLAHNSATLQALLHAAGLYRLSLGRAPDGILAAIEALS